MSTISLDGVSSAADVATSSASVDATSELGQDAFLNLLVTQLQNQDPLNPQANEEFVAQLAQFTQVEQLTSANTALQSLYGAMASMNNASMTQLLGKHVRAHGDTFHYDGSGESVDLHYNATTDTSSATLTITDESGKVVYSTELGGLDEGDGTVTWNGNVLSGGDADEGDYTFSISATDSDGDEVTVMEIVEGEIDGMSFETGTPIPSIQGVDISLGEIIFVSTGEEGDGVSDNDEEADQ